jgi:uncharacterized protein (TIGR02145 family)
MKISFMFIFAISILLFSSCKKEEPKPGVITQPVSAVSRTAALFKGTVVPTDSGSVVEAGFCWSTGNEPTISDDHGGADYWEGHNEIYLDKTGLLSGTKYYMRAFAKTTDGAVYGKVVSFSTKPMTYKKSFNPLLSYGAVSDIDGNSYKTIQIGAQLWMAENLKTTRLNDGSAISLVPDIDSWNHLLTPGYCWYENDEAFYGNLYGALYNWYSVGTGLLCPTGWHVPDEADWKELKMYLGMTNEQAELLFGIAGTNEGDKIKESGSVNWAEGGKGGTNESGFTALPGGVRKAGAPIYAAEGIVANWWSSTARLTAWCHGVAYDASGIWRSDMYLKDYGLNVRCIKDN